jgi:hypothetical protein
MGDTRRLLVGLAAALMVFIAGCGTPPWKQANANPTASSTPAGIPSASPSHPRTPASPPPRRNDLATGSAKRTVQAGGVRMKINYWSELDMSEWTAGAAKPLSESASAVFIDGSEQNIFLAKASVIISVDGPKGALKAPAPLMDISSVRPGYLIKKPNSYGQVFTIPALAESARSVTLTLTYELLVQSAPKAKTYSKQTASLDLVISIQT